jgi:hypothetical protein
MEGRLASDSHRLRPERTSPAGAGVEEGGIVPGGLSHAS